MPTDRYGQTHKTKTGSNCPICKKKNSTAIVAIQPMVVGDKVLDAGCYAVCVDCYREQWQVVYGDNLNMTFDEYLKQNRERKAAERAERLVEQEERANNPVNIPW